MLVVAEVKAIATYNTFSPIVKKSLYCTVFADQNSLVKLYIPPIPYPST